MIERDQQRQIAGDDLREHARSSADLRSSTLIHQQAGQNFLLGLTALWD